MLEWMISTAIALFFVFVLCCFIVDAENTNYWFSQFSIIQKIARVTVYSVAIGSCIGLFIFVVFAIKRIIF